MQMNMAESAHLCHCGRPSRVWTSWKPTNPGRRFFGCGDYGHNGGRGCRYFEWYDPPICARATIVIPGLLRRVESLEEVNKGLRVCIKKLRLMLVVAVMLVVWLVFGGIRSYFAGNNVEDPNIEYYNS